MPHCIITEPSQTRAATPQAALPFGCVSLGFSSVSPYLPVAGPRPPWVANQKTSLPSLTSTGSLPWKDISGVSTVTECAPRARHCPECFLGLHQFHPQSHPLSTITVPRLSFEETEVQSSEVIHLGPHSPSFSALSPPGEHVPVFFPVSPEDSFYSDQFPLLKCSCTWWLIESKANPLFSTHCPQRRGWGGGVW